VEIGKSENILPKCQKLNTTICKQTHYMMNVFQEISRAVRMHYVQSLYVNFNKVID